MFEACLPRTSQHLCRRLLYDEIVHCKQGPLPATPPGKGTTEQQQPPQWVAGSPTAMQLWARWFRDLGALCLLLLSLWLLRRAVRDAAAGTAVAAGGSTGGPEFWQDRRIVLQPGSAGPVLQALPAVTSQ